VELAVGIDVGFSAGRRSTGVVVLDRSTKAVVKGSQPQVCTGKDAVALVCTEMVGLNPTAVVVVVDGPFAGAEPPAKVRRIERFFGSGPFASTPPNGAARLRLMPAPTKSGSPFLASTRNIVDALRAAGHQELTLTSAGLTGTVIEIFPTIFMASLLPPHAYMGERDDHTDDLWEKLIGSSPLHGTSQMCNPLGRYDSLIADIENASWGDRHDLRAAAISAIAADWFASLPPSTGKSTAATYIAHATEGGFLMPPRALCDPEFLAIIDGHRATSSVSGLTWH
jgi:hypothetical protein